jgi:GTP-binding protein
MPQTRFVLQKALELNHRVICVVNKIDKAEARPKEVVDEVLELLLDLGGSEEQLESPFVFCSCRQGVASIDPDTMGVDMKPLFETIVSYIPEPKTDTSSPFQMLVSSSEHNDYLGKLSIGKVERGVLKVNDTVAVANFYGESQAKPFKVVNIFAYEGLKKVALSEATAGDIVCIAGSQEVTIGDTLCDKNLVEAIPFVKISEPSVQMTFSVNNSPFAGKEGKFCTSRHLRDRLYKESIKDLSLKVQDTESADSFTVLGRGEMHISILIENMRRDGYEFQVSMPKVLYKEIDGVKYEPIDRFVADVPEDSVGAVMSEIGNRKGELVTMSVHGSRTRLEFLIPSRGLFGYKSQFLTDTKGEGIMSSIFEKYDVFKGNIDRRNFGALIAYENGEACQYGLYNSQDRGRMLITTGTQVYGGMVVGINPKGNDIVVNVCKKKQLTNMRSSASDEALRLEAPKIMTLEECLEFLDDDELLEVTPKSLRIRKIVLDHVQRGRMDFRKKHEMD